MNERTKTTKGSRSRVSDRAAFARGYELIWPKKKPARKKDHDNDDSDGSKSA